MSLSFKSFFLGLSPIPLDFMIPESLQQYKSLYLESHLVLRLLLIITVCAFVEKWYKKHYSSVEANRVIYSVVLYIFVATLLGFGLFGYIFTDPSITNTAFYENSYVEHGFHRFIKLIVYLSTAGVLMISSAYLRQNAMALYEYLALIIFALIGIIFLISSSDLLFMYLSIELMSLSFYLLAAFNRNDPLATEAGLKYFILGAFSSGLLLFGMSLVYGSTGSTNYEHIMNIIALPGFSQLEPVILGMALILSSLLFKIAAAPFHMWIPDVYQGAPTTSTAFFSIVPKIAIIGVLFQLMYHVFGSLFDYWGHIILVCSLLSMIIGALGAINQTSIKRLFSYSAIGHTGYALMGVATGSLDGVSSVLLYLLIYVVTLLGIFGIILSLRSETGEYTDKLDDLAGLSKTHPILTGALTVLMFSIAGIPPLAGFFAKWYVFLAAVKVSYFFPVVIAVITSVIGSFYYIRIIKIMYFGDQNGIRLLPIDMSNIVVIGVSILFTMFFFTAANNVVMYLFEMASSWFIMY